MKIPLNCGFSEGFVHIMPFPGAKIARELIDGWMKDYHEHHPHPVLNQRSAKRNDAPLASSLQLKSNRISV
jgi:hypothetical protein